MGGKRKVVWLVIAIIAAVGISLAVFLTQNLQKNSGLQVDAFPRAKVFLDSREIGSSPFYQENLEAGDYTLKLTTDTGGIFETRVKLEPGVLTMVTRVFGPTEEFSSGQIAYLTRSSLPDFGSLMIVSQPDEALVRINGEDKGITPLSLKDVKPGSHDVMIVKPGFEPQTVNGKVEKGYVLNVLAQLGKASDQVGLEASAAAVPVASVSGATAATIASVTIKETGVGFLRVREKPSIASREIGRVKPGDKLPYLSEKADWVEVKFATESGWISRTYVEKPSP